MKKKKSFSFDHKKTILGAVVCGIRSWVAVVQLKYY